jgi:hypothetical protein
MGKWVVRAFGAHPELALTVAFATIGACGCDPGWSDSVPGVAGTMDDGLRYDVPSESLGVAARLYAGAFTGSLHAEWRITNLEDDPLDFSGAKTSVFDAKGTTLPEVVDQRVRCDTGDGSPRAVSKGALAEDLQEPYRQNRGRGRVLPGDQISVLDHVRLPYLAAAEVDADLFLEIGEAHGSGGAAAAARGMLWFACGDDA